MGSTLKAKKKNEVKPLLESEITSQFAKDWERLVRSGRYDMTLLKAVMIQLVADEIPLDPSRKDHPIQGTWKGFRECHIRGDFLLIYKVDRGKIVFARSGTHSELFG